MCLDRKYSNDHPLEMVKLTVSLGILVYTGWDKEGQLLPPHARMGFTLMPVFFW